MRGFGIGAKCTVSTPTKAWAALVLILIALITVLRWAGSSPEAGQQDAPSQTTTVPLPADEPDDPRQEDQGWKRVVDPRPFTFPRDHAAHEDYRIEWWYYTGNVRTAEGRPFGYQLTFFRTGVVREPDNPSRWTIRNLYTAHFAISDIRARRHHVFERTRRRGVGWAGAATDRYHVWNGDWEVRLEGEQHRLVAAEDDFRIELNLTPLKPVVLHRDRGVSRKGPSQGNASYYYSFTRLDTKGLLEIEGEAFSVTGQSWMDHEFSSSFLEKGQQGWDWLCIQLDDGRELMIYQIRREDGTIDPFSSGTLVDPSGKPEHLGRDDFSLLPAGQWKSDQTGAAYPTRWTVHLPAHRLKLSATAAFPAQEMNTAASSGVVYWEGSIGVKGTADGEPVTGTGYLEMTGCAGSLSPGR